jgi:hypothetical protein
MRTPAGSECRHYYQDFHRGRDLQECRLAKNDPASAPWKPGDCTNCPVPGILAANSSPDLELRLAIKYRLLVIGRYNEVTARCSRHNLVIDDPHVGCPKCNAERPGLDIFLRALEDSGDDDGTRPAD